MTPSEFSSRFDEMRKKSPQASPPPLIDEEDALLFRQAAGQVKPLQQDKVRLTQATVTKTFVHTPSGKVSKQLAASFFFSDQYQTPLPDTGPVRYLREGAPSQCLKQLRRGQYAPDLVLDLHGLTREQSKHELAALLDTAEREHLPCVSVMHGHGEGVLKQALPHYLAQHPSVLAFHQAPLEYGGKAALLVLVGTVVNEHVSVIGHHDYHDKYS